MYDLYKYRKDNGLRQADISNAITVPQPTISAYENGEGNESLEKKLKRAFPLIQGYKKKEVIAVTVEDILEIQRDLIEDLKFMLKQKDDIISALMADR